MTKVILDREVFNQMVSVLAQLPYSQVAGVLQQVGNNLEEVVEDGTDELSTGDDNHNANNTDSRGDSVRSED